MDDKKEKKEERRFLPASLVNAGRYCRRLAYLQYAHQEWSDTGDTLKGRRVHKRVDREKGALPPPDQIKDIKRPFQVRSLALSSDKLGLISKIDLLETEGPYVIPIEYKKGKQPARMREKKGLSPEEAQLCAQAMTLKDNGYSCKKGMIYYAGSGKRVSVDFTEEMLEQTKQIINNLKKDIKQERAPEPLEDSSKCPRCSLVEICLPDEFYFLKKEKSKIRPVSLKAETSFPVYVQSYQGKVSKKGHRLEVKIDEENVKSIPLMDISQLALMGNVSITTPCLHELMRREIPVTWHSYGGWFLGITQGMGHKNAALREAQYRKSFDESFCLEFSKTLVKAKIQNCRTILRRNWRPEKSPKFLLITLKKYADMADKAKDFKTLLGVEAYAAKNYFQSFNSMIKHQEGFPFAFEKRTRRPPEDPVNLLLSFSYAMLVRLWTVALSAAGFDPFRGFYHKSRYGRPALALDMMEPFRSLICDSSVLLAINNKEVKPDQFTRSGGKVGWTEKGRKNFISVFERRLNQELTHSVFKYKLSYRQLLDVQAKLFARHLFGEIEEYPHFMTR